MKSGSKALVIALLLVGLVLVNYLASSIPVRLDATADSIYSLSPGTKAILGKIEEPIVLDFYFSRDTTALPITIKNYATRVEEMLRQYVRASRGKLTLNVVNVQPDTPAEEKATADGVSPLSLAGENLFFGLAVTQADQTKSISTFLSPNQQNPLLREPFLEYDLSKVIYAVQQIDKPKLGLLTSLPLQGSSPQDMQMMMMMRQQPQPAHYIISELEQSFTVVTVDPAAAEIPSGLVALAVIHPQNLSPKLQFAIDQFLLGGKPVFLAVDPASAYFKQRSNPQQAMMGGGAPNTSSDLPALLNAYGIAYDATKVVGDPMNALQINSRNGVVRMPTYLDLRKENFNPAALPTAQLNSAWFIESGSLALKPGSNLTFTPLVETSAQAGELPAMMLQFAQGDDIAKQITGSSKKTVAALVTGKFKTAFPDGAPKDDPKPGEKKEGEPAAATSPAAAPSGEALKESKTMSTLFVVADTDWILDDYSLQKISFLGQTAYQPYNDNTALASNTIEFLGGSQDLISVRGKGSAIRQFTVVQAMQAEAQNKYQEKLTELETRLADVQKKLNEMQAKKTEGNRLVASPEVAKIIGDFQKQQAAMNVERRQIRRALTQDIDWLEKKLLVLNLVVPLLIVGLVGLWYSRARRRAAPAEPAVSAPASSLSS
jgi:ABC-type uncharacterized transport system involved in gliding motility auxiliary subunit